MTEQEFPTRFAKELNALMEAHEPPLSIAELADSLGLTYEFIRKVARGYNLPTRGSLIIMAQVFNVEVAWLEEIVKEDKLAYEFGRDVANILFSPDTKALVHGMAMLPEAEKKEVLTLLRSLLKSHGKKPGRKTS